MSQRLHVGLGALSAQKLQYTRNHALTALRTWAQGVVVAASDDVWT